VFATDGGSSVIEETRWPPELTRSCHMKDIAGCVSQPRDRGSNPRTATKIPRLIFFNHLISDAVLAAVAVVSAPEFDDLGRRSSDSIHTANRRRI